MPSKVHMLRGQWQWNTPYAATLKRIRTVRQVKLPTQGRPASPSRTMLSPSHVSSIPDASGKLVTWTKKQGFRSHKSQQNHFKITSWVDPRFIFMYRMCMMCTLKRINAWSILPHFKGYLSSVTWEIIGSVQENICIPEHLSVSTAYQKHPTRNISINTNDVHIGICIYIYMHTCVVYITKAPSHQKTTSFTQILTASVWVKAVNLRWRKIHFVAPSLRYRCDRAPGPLVKRWQRSIGTWWGAIFRHFLFRLRHGGASL